ncbi:unnamed protein product [Chironomus riparius]|uniref:Uncharacterized protein n=1 Tax=Chironomus riparius TaxID=315576 RepID=A0A9N9WQ44_9DIPT|nr:unnamed protein product [Chironomus riparius]
MDFCMKGLIANVMLDIVNFLSYIDEFGRPNCKYFNYVLNKLGFMHIFLYKNRIFRNKSYIIIKFADNTLIALKKKFLEEKSNLRRSALIFLISKIYFTDDVATNLKLRVVKDEWEQFLKFFNNVKQLEEYQDVCIMFCHLYTENFFRFTMKSITLALDYGENQQSNVYDISSTTMFWNELDDDVKNMNQIDVEELKKLDELRKQSIQPFEHSIPEVVKVSEIFNEFADVQKALDKFKEAETSKKTRREMLQVCRDYLKTNTLPSSRKSEDDISSLTSIIQPSTSKTALRKLSKLDNSSDSDTELDILKSCYE